MPKEKKKKNKAEQKEENINENADEQIIATVKKEKEKEEEEENMNVEEDDEQDDDIWKDDMMDNGKKKKRKEERKKKRALQQQQQDEEAVWSDGSQEEAVVPAQQSKKNKKKGKSVQQDEPKEEPTSNSKAGKKEKKKKGGKGGDGGKQMMKEMAETRREGLEYGEELMQTMEAKLIKYFDDDKKELFMETVKEALDFYEENWTQSYNEEVFEEKKQEIHAAWTEILKACRASWVEDNKEVLEAHEEQRKLEERKKKMEKLGIKSKTDTNATKSTREHNNKPKVLSQKQLEKQRLKEIKQKLLEQEEEEKKAQEAKATSNKNEENKESPPDSENQDEDKDKDKHKDTTSPKKKQENLKPVKSEEEEEEGEEEEEEEEEEEKKENKEEGSDDDWSTEDEEPKAKAKKKPVKITGLDDEDGFSSSKKVVPKGGQKRFDDDLSDNENNSKKKGAKKRKAKKAKAKKAQEQSQSQQPNKADVKETEKDKEKEKDKDKENATTEAKPKKSKKDKSKDKDKDKDKGGPLKSPIVVVMGHVDTGKTKILDRIRHTSVQDREVGGITQQIGATYLTKEYISKATARMNEQTNKTLVSRLPGLLFIDTPGHEAFANLRARGSSICDIAVLVVDLMHGLEPQTIESLKMLKERRAPFVVALNKVDRCLDWIADEGAPFQLTLAKQKTHTRQEFETRVVGIKTEFAQNGWNTELYYKNKNVKTDISLVPTSALTGEGIPDLLELLVQLSQTYMERQLRFKDKFVCTVLEVKHTVGHGTTLDVILSNGTLRKDDTIVVCGMPPQGPIVTNIRALLLPSEASEMRDRAEYKNVDEVNASAGVRVSANGLEHAVAGAHMQIVPRHLKNSKDHNKRKEEIENLKDEVQQDYTSVFKKISRQQRGVYVQASTLGSLEALITFLQDLKPPIPICGINIGDIHKQDVIKAGVMLEHQPEFAVILAFNVRVDPEARELATQMGVQIFTSEIIYHLEEAFQKYIQEIYDQRKAGAKDMAVFPVELEILPEHIIHNKYPIVLGVKVVRGTLRKLTPLCAKKFDSSGVAAPLYLGRISGIQSEKKDIEVAKVGEKVAIKIEGDETVKNIQYGRQFDEHNRLVSMISRDSLDALKNNFKTDLDPDDVKHLHELKTYFSVI